MTPADASTAPNWSFRADEAARSVTRLFGQRLFFLPGTHIAAVVRPSGRLKNLARPWHYWWQAHYVDCLVDAGRRELGSTDQPGGRFDGENRPSAGQLASELVAGIRLRNFLTFVNNYFDDMAWLALATLRLEDLAEDTRRPAGRRRNAKVLAEPDPAVRLGLHRRPRRRHLLEQETGFQEHPRHRPGGPLLRPHGQRGQGAGPAGLAGRPALRPGTGHVPGRPAHFRAAARWCWNTASIPTTRGPSSAPSWSSAAPPTWSARPSSWRRRRAASPSPHRCWTAPPPCCAAKETATAASSPGSWSATWHSPRSTAGCRPKPGPAAAAMVNDTAEAFWEGRPHHPGPGPPGAQGRPAVVFGPPGLPARRSYPAGAAVELSTQLQAWMVLEAAAAIAGDRRTGRGKPGVKFNCDQLSHATVS